MPYVQCAILGYREFFSIKIGSDMLMVSDLVYEMRKTEHTLLGSFTTSALLLYKVDIPVSSNTAFHEILETIHLGSVEYSEDQKLQHFTELSSVFGTTGRLRRAINILVKPLTGESFDPRPQRRHTPFIPH